MTPELLDLYLYGAVVLTLAVYLLFDYATLLLKKWKWSEHYEQISRVYHLVGLILSVALSKHLLNIPLVVRMLSDQMYIQGHYLATSYIPSDNVVDLQPYTFTVDSTAAEKEHGLLTAMQGADPHLVWDAGVSKFQILKMKKKVPFRDEIYLEDFEIKQTLLACTITGHSVDTARNSAGQVDSLILSTWEGELAEYSGNTFTFVVTVRSSGSNGYATFVFQFDHDRVNGYFQSHARKENYAFIIHGRKANG